jgi:uncharacterized protein (DUF924 family)
VGFDAAGRQRGQRLMAHDISRIDEILTFWFGRNEGSSFAARKALWFGGGQGFDNEVRRKLAADHEQAAARHLDHWQETPRGCLALVLLLDQVPRNIFRGSPRAYATDARALDIAEHGFTSGFDRLLPPAQRLFLGLPFMHSERLQHQHRALAVARQCHVEDSEMEDAVKNALQHLAIIERFGRFPHRDALLGRRTTLEEAAFLQEPGSSF